ncbi:hypothetical protein ACJQWK_00178 [Exserohilum turcicum]
MSGRKQSSSSSANGGKPLPHGSTLNEHRVSKRVKALKAHGKARVTLLHAQARAAEADADVEAAKLRFEAATMELEKTNEDTLEQDRDEELEEHKIKEEEEYGAGLEGMEDDVSVYDV